MAPEALTQVLRPLADLFPPERYREVLVGLRPSDDAAVYRVHDSLAIVATLDFFTPVVDDPYSYGAIAATNALSDVYAMGARPVLAMNIACLSGCLPADIIAEILRGGAEKVAEAGAALVGGHSVDDKEPKYGLCAIGLIEPDRVWTKANAHPGDVLVLTKPLGVGVVTTALKRDRATPAQLDAAVASMTRLSAPWVEPLHAAGVRAATDVTGFALLGSACEMAERSGVLVRLYGDIAPLLPGALELARDGCLPGGTKRNRAAFGPMTIVEDGVDPALVQIFFTPETSGGLLACVRPDRLTDLHAACSKQGLDLWVVGDVQPSVGEPGVRVTSQRPSG